MAATSRLNDQRNILRAAVGLALATAPMICAFAQDTGSAQGLEEVIVTAQRREQRLQETPVAVTAVSGEELAARNMQNANSLVGVVPSFSIRDAGQTVQYSLRGYVSTDARSVADQPVALYIDDVFLGGTILTQMESVDVKRIEALRGPQGTLFGRNATGGLIHFISNGPTEELDGKVSLQLGDYDERILEGAIGGPLGQSLRGRIALKYNYNGGWQKNLMGGEDRDSKDALAGRAQLAWDISSDLTATLSFQFDRERNQYQGFSSFGTLSQDASSICSYQQIRSLKCYIGGAPFSNVAAGTRSLATYEPDRIYSTMGKSPFDFDAYIGIGRLDWKANANLTISSISAVAGGNRTFVEDDNATGLANNDPFNFLGHDADIHQFSQEFRASGETDGGMDYVAGLYYLNSSKTYLLTLQDGDGKTPIFYLGPKEMLDTESLAAFGQLEYPFTDSLRAIIGGRVTYEKKTLERTLRPGFIDLGTSERLPTSSGSTTEPTGKIGLQWIINPGLNFYGHISTGFKSAEYASDKADAKLKLVDPEKVTSLELGMKSQWLDDRLALNAAVFSSKIKNKQSTTSIRDPNTGAQVPYFVNFGDVDQLGAELELTAQLFDSLLLSGNVSYIDNSIDPAKNITVERLAFFNSYTLKDNQLPGAPPFQAGATAEWTLPIPTTGALALAVDWRWVDKQYWNLSNNEVEIEPSYDVGNVRLGYTSKDSRWLLSAFCNNVTNTKVANVNFSFAGSDALTVQWGKPRWYGVRGEYRF